MESSNIDEAILSTPNIAGRWQKVAMVILEVSKAMGNDLSDDNLHLIAGRLEALVKQGRLAAQGDLSNWRRSEVRLPE